jgi:hypothetical protein
MSLQKMVSPGGGAKTARITDLSAKTTNLSEAAKDRLTNQGR